MVSAGVPLPDPRHNHLLALLEQRAAQAKWRLRGYSKLGGKIKDYIESDQRGKDGEHPELAAE